MKAQEKRKPRSYKVKETPYAKAVRRAWDESTTLAAILEAVVICYSDPNYRIVINGPNSSRGIKTVLHDLHSEPKKSKQ